MGLQVLLPTLALLLPEHLRLDFAYLFWLCWVVGQLEPSMDRVAGSCLGDRQRLDQPNCLSSLLSAICPFRDGGYVKRKGYAMDRGAKRVSAMRSGPNCPRGNRRAPALDGLLEKIVEALLLWRAILGPARPTGRRRGHRKGEKYGRQEQHESIFQSFHHRKQVQKGLGRMLKHELRAHRKVRVGRPTNRWAKPKYHQAHRHGRRRRRRW
mmetsp:Transcript_14212/g.31434  ORF Transcript_14212/g.31434 Transcript_14212/m.31434 type:complete len:210 (+) Transcript_14212:241-870(+)